MRINSMQMSKKIMKKLTRLHYCQSSMPDFIKTDDDDAEEEDDAAATDKKAAKK